MCDSTFKIKYSLQKHSKKHSRQDQVSHQVCCFKGCAFSCLAWAEMKRHKKEDHSGKKGFFCFKCEKPFPKFPRLVAHKRKVHNSLLLKCWRRKISVTLSRTIKWPILRINLDAMNGEEKKA